MTGEIDKAVDTLTQRFLLDHPTLAAQQIEALSRSEAAEALADYDANTLVPVLARVAPDVAAEIAALLPDALVTAVLAELPPGDAARILGAHEPDQRERLLAALPSPIARELRRVMTYPSDSAGQLMDTRIRYFEDTTTVGATLDRLRAARAKASRSLFIVDDDSKLSGRVGIQELALAQPATPLKALAQPVLAFANPLMSREEVVDLLEKFKLVDLPVVGPEGRLLGMIYHKDLIQAIHEDATADIQTMVGASADEKALSPASFAVRKRLPWLQINLLTAFMAAAVVGLFESTIAQFTALAVLLPVVAGQSGNAGAQALAVTMRGLALREITLRQWLQVTVKEVQTGFINGVAVALTCGIGVYVWSGSIGLVLVIAISMVLAMVAAGFAGALVPITLTRLGQDPAQSSSIILTTVTDIAGFFSFLGIATVLANLL
jgi:magnesium transporter